MIGLQEVAHTDEQEARGRKTLRNCGFKRNCPLTEKLSECTGKSDDLRWTIVASACALSLDALRDAKNALEAGVAKQEAARKANIEAESEPRQPETIDKLASIAQIARS